MPFGCCLETVGLGRKSFTHTLWKTFGSGCFPPFGAGNAAWILKLFPQNWVLVCAFRPAWGAGRLEMNCVSKRGCGV